MQHSEHSWALGVLVHLRSTCSTFLLRQRVRTAPGYCSTGPYVRTGTAVPELVEYRYRATQSTKFSTAAAGASLRLKHCHWLLK
eukprot:SAG31_NODE_774_length_12192_cov_26.736128_9_plen_84_part_00